MNLKYILFKKFDIFNIFKKLKYSYKIVKIKNIRCQTGREFSNYLGFGSKHIIFFPPYIFFKKYLIDEIEARKEFKNWLYINFVEKNGWNIPKSKGGYYLGSLYSEIEKIFDKHDLIINSKNLLNQKDLIESAINKRIDNYFTTFKSIKDKGFIPDLQPITAKKINGLYYLNNGHHRIAMLYVLGYKKVLLLKERIIFSSFKRKFLKI